MDIIESMEERIHNNTEEKGNGDNMPTIELIEYERTIYVNGMKKYLLNLKEMSHKEAQKVARDNLIRSQIIEDNGAFTERYKYSRQLDEE